MPAPPTLPTAAPLARATFPPSQTSIIVLIPAHNEEGSIAATIEAALAQTRVPDLVVVAANGCTDRTAEIARGYGVTVMELPPLEHRKSEALNLAWNTYARDADYVISLDADTRLPPDAVARWERELTCDQGIGGSTAKFTVQTPGLVGRLQKAEYATNIQLSLDRGWTHVLAGAGTMFSNLALHRIAARPDRSGPWSYSSAVEDYELTYRLRERGYRTLVSPTVRAYTDGMGTVRALWGQRMKWHVGTLHDLVDLGVNRWTRWDWRVQVASLLAPLTRLLWLAVLVLALTLDGVDLVWWAWGFAVLFLLQNLRNLFLIPHRDRTDGLIAATVLPMELFQTIRSAWVLAAWLEVSLRLITNTRRDLWAAQYAAEGA